MNCKNYNNLTHLEKVEFIGKLIHACQSSNTLFNEGKKIIQFAESCGLMGGVKVGIEAINCHRKQSDYEQ